MHPQRPDSTFKDLSSTTISLNKLWDSVEGLRLFRFGHFREFNGGQWRHAVPNSFGFPSLIEYTSTQLAAAAAAAVAPDSENSLETVINKLFRLQTGQGVFHQANIRMTCAFPAVIRVQYTSTEPIPGSAPPNLDESDETNPRNPAYDWLRDGPGQDLRGFTILQERWNIKSADLPRRQQPYRLMAVVRMRNSVEEPDLVRVYSDVGECILPMTTDLVYFSGVWRSQIGSSCFITCLARITRGVRLWG